MKLAFISDIHGNAVALEAVLADIAEKRVDQIVVLGDICYRGPQPKEALQLIRTLDTAVIKGNADEWLVRGVQQGEVPEQALSIMQQEREWCLERLEAKDLQYLQSLPTEWKLEERGLPSIHAFHATPTNLFEIVLPERKKEDLQEKLMSAQPAAELYLYAHIHLPYVRYFGGKCVANLGSVGLPFDGLAKSSYALVELEEQRFRVTIERVAYDIEQVVQQYKEVDYPNQEVMQRVIREGLPPVLK